jgi:hypothetical protein
MLHLFLGYYVVSLIFIPKPFQYLNRSQALRMASQYFECAQQEGKWVDMMEDYNFCIVIDPRSNHTNTNAFSKSPMGETKDNEDI